MAKTEITKSPESTRPRDVFSAMRDELDRVFDRFEQGPRWPALFRFGGAMTAANGVLTIKGEKKQETEDKGENYHVTERSFGSFERSIRLPETIDEGKVEAKFDKGVLKVTAAKKPEAVKAERRIEIKKA
jgi:hypothetical protein